MPTDTPALTGQYATFQFRLRDTHSAELNRQARMVNFVWNYCNEMQQKAARAGRKWLSDPELQRLTAGSSRMLGIRSQTICKVCQQYVRSRYQQKKPWLRFRGRRSLGWVPLHPEIIRIRERSFWFMGKAIVPMHWRDIPAGAAVRSGSFSRDARGRWYLNLLLWMPKAPEQSKSIALGIDLGLKDLATLSTGEKIEAPRHYRSLEHKLGMAQRAKKRKLKRTISARIANARKDHLHKVSTRLALAHDTIIVGNVSSSKLAQTRMTKSVLDAGWSTFRTMLSYKAIRHGGRYLEIDERMTSQTCSSCGCVPPERPRGIAGLGIREWTCGGCGETHDRDVNAARNILRRGLATLAEGAGAHFLERPTCLIPFKEVTHDT